MIFKHLLSLHIPRVQRRTADTKSQGIQRIWKINVLVLVNNHNHKLHPVSNYLLENLVPFNADRVINVITRTNCFSIIILHIKFSASKMGVSLTRGQWHNARMLVLRQITSLCCIYTRDFGTNNNNCIDPMSIFITNKKGYIIRVFFSICTMAA